MGFIVENKTSLSSKSYKEIASIVSNYLHDFSNYLTDAVTTSEQASSIMWSYSNFINYLLSALEAAEKEANAIEVDGEDSDSEDLIYAEAEVLALKKSLRSMMDRSYKDVDHLRDRNRNLTFSVANPYATSSYLPQIYAKRGGINYNSRLLGNP